MHHAGNNGSSTKHAKFSHPTYCYTGRTLSLDSDKNNLPIDISSALLLQYDRNLDDWQGFFSLTHLFCVAQLQALADHLKIKFKVFQFIGILVFFTVCYCILGAKSHL